MATTELLNQNLAIEPDLQNFIGFVLSAVNQLGGNSFSAAIAALGLTQKLRDDGAASGYPLPASLLLRDARLVVQWNGANETLISYLARAPHPEIIEQLRLYLQQSTEIADPSVLLRRNAEMTRFLDETRVRTEKEIEIMQQTLAQRQEELGESIRKSETDPLTGLFNRRAYDEKLEQAFRRTLRQHGEVMSLILFDLDFFKQINDEHGHQYGDAYLNKMAQAMLTVIRLGVDYCFRFGGDEFAILLFADKNVACRKALQVLKQMSNKVSIGVASVSSEEPCEDELQKFIHRADDAL